MGSYQAQQNQYQAQINTLNAQLAQLNATDTNPQSTLSTTISTLQSTIPSLQQQIDYIKFNCLGVANYTTNTLNGSISYTLGPSSFSTYMSGQYGAPNSNTAQALLGPITNITLTPASILSSTWTTLYGQPFAKDLALASASTIATPNLFVSDFTCSSLLAGGSPLAGGSGNGVVKQISGNVVSATAGDKSEVTLALGGCSSVMVNNLMPRVGRNVFWSGLKLANGTYQVYSALFI